MAEAGGGGVQKRGQGSCGGGRTCQRGGGGVRGFYTFTREIHVCALKRGSDEEVCEGFHRNCV